MNRLAERPVPEKELDVFELELAIKWAHGAALMDTHPEVSYLFALSETALKEKLERLKSAPPPNDPLTLEELREMDGDPVWVVQPGYEPGWALVRITWTVTMLIFSDGKMVAAEFAMLEKGCKIYRRRPEVPANAK